MNDTGADMVRDALMRHGMDPDLARHIDLARTEGPDGPRGLVTIGYVRAGRRHETAMVSTPTPDEAVALVMDRDRIAALLSLGVRAMPSGERPPLPDWVARHPGAQETRRGLDRARALAADAANGRLHEDKAEADGDLPF